MTLVPAGCRSPGRCFGNHSRQPDGISVGEREKDGSGSLLPGEKAPGPEGGVCGRPGAENVWSNQVETNDSESSLTEVLKKDSQGHGNPHLIFTFDKLLRRRLCSPVL